MLKILTVNPQKYQDSILKLFEEYLRFNQKVIAECLNIHFDLNAILKQEPKKLSQFSPPTGFFLCVQDNLKMIGCAGLRSLTPQISEIKRVYLKPEYRRQGVGRLLLKTLLEKATKSGFKRVRLDCFQGLIAAKNLYKSLGFQDIQPYLESEIPREYHQHWLFLEKQLH